MKMKKHILILLLILMVLPAIQNSFQPFHLRELTGDHIPKEKPKFSFKTYFSGEYQNPYSDYLDENIGFRNFFVRLNNQIDYSLFGEIHAEGIVQGGSGQLYETDYIREYLGEFFIGEKTIREKINRFKFVQDTLKKLGVDLILVLAPGKASFYPESFPEEYSGLEKKLSNYDCILKTAKSENINLLDLNNFFLLAKDSSGYPLYPKGGIHWSEYGAMLAADTMIRYMEKISNIKMNKLVLDSIEISNTPRLTDDDLERTLNLLFRLPQQSLAYPLLRIKEENAHFKPSVLVIGDSYYFNLFNTLITERVFSNKKFWFYAHKVYPDFYTTPSYVGDLNIKDEIERQDIVLILITERFLHTIFWDFIEMAYAAYHPNYQKNGIRQYENLIRGDETWFKALLKESQEKGVSLENIIKEAAGDQFARDYKEMKNPRPIDHIVFNQWRIRNDEKWFNSIKKTALEKKLDLDSLIHANAVWVYEHDLRQNK